MHHTPERQGQSTPDGMTAGGRWGDRIGEERKVELELLLQEWQIEARRGDMSLNLESLGSDSSLRHAMVMLSCSCYPCD